jgi:hypothetical protein
MKKIIALLMTCLMAVSLAACSYSIHDKEKKEESGTENIQEADTEAAAETAAAEEAGTETAAEAVTQAGAEAAAEAATEEEPEETGTQIPNPYVDYESLEEACEAVGVSLRLPDSIEGYERIDYQAIDGQMVNVIYTAADGSMLLIRKAKGSEDISGDYNEYEHNSEQTINDIDVQVRGNGDTLSAAVWYDNGEAYSMTVDRPMEKDRGLELLQQLIDLNTIFDEDGPEE